MTKPLIKIHMGAGTYTVTAGDTTVELSKAPKEERYAVRRAVIDALFPKSNTKPASSRRQRRKTKQ